MGIYFRRSINFGPFRLNFSKSGIGYSLGTPWLRFGSGPRGKRISSTIPGTGINYRSDISGGKPSVEDESREIVFTNPKKSVIVYLAILILTQTAALYFLENYLQNRALPLNQNNLAILWMVALLPTFGFGSRVCYAVVASIESAESFKKKMFFALGRTLESLMIVTLLAGLVAILVLVKMLASSGKGRAKRRK